MLQKVYFAKFFAQSGVKRLIIAAFCDILYRLNCAGVVEWQTRRTQNPMLETTCGFKSHHQHQCITPYFMRSNFFCSGVVRVRCGGILRKDGFVAFAASAAARLRADGRTQNPMLETTCGFKSHHQHQCITPYFMRSNFFCSGVVRVRCGGIPRKDGSVAFAARGFSSFGTQRQKFDFSFVCGFPK